MRRPELRAFRRIKDSHGDRVVAVIALAGIKGEPYEQHELTQDMALALLAQLADSVQRVKP